MIAILGPDGCGKSSVISALEASPPGGFERVTTYHLRPSCFSKNTGSKTVADPHAQSPRGPFLSIVKIFYLLLDYLVGWLGILYSQRTRHSLVIFDRYYHDMLVDPRRYRYGGPMWLARWVGKLIPKPDLWILLDAPPKVVQERTQEVPFAETTRQRGEYLKLVKGLKKGFVVDAAQDLDGVIADVNAIILDFMAQRKEKRSGRLNAMRSMDLPAVMDKSYTFTFQNSSSAHHYTNNVYSPLSYDTFIWTIQKLKLRKIIESSFVNVGNLQHLDFACGTGRIIKFLHSFVGFTTGVDTSFDMLNLARTKSDNITLVLGDLIKYENVCNQKYDLITAFRFFLNAEPDLQKKAMAALSKRLNEKNGRLIFNIHGNKHSSRYFSIMLRKRNKERVCEMSFNQVKQLVKEAGLEIESWYGFGILPQFFHRTKLRPIIKGLDIFFSKLPFLKSISCDLLFVCKKQPEKLYEF